MEFCGSYTTLPCTFTVIKMSVKLSKFSKIDCTRKLTFPGRQETVETVDCRTQGRLKHE